MPCWGAKQRPGYVFIRRGLSTLTKENYMGREHHTPKPNTKECEEQIHAIEWCKPCNAVICTTCKDEECSLLKVIGSSSLVKYRPAPNPYGVTYQLNLL